MICHLCQKELAQVNSYNAGIKDRLYIFSCNNKDCFRPTSTEYKVVVTNKNDKIKIEHYALTFLVQDKGYYKIISSALSDPFTTLYEINAYSKHLKIKTTQRELIKIPKFFPLNQEDDWLLKTAVLYSKLKSLLVFS